MVIQKLSPSLWWTIINFLLAKLRDTSLCFKLATGVLHVYVRSFRIKTALPPCLIPYWVSICYFFVSHRNWYSSAGQQGRSFFPARYTFELWANNLLSKSCLSTGAEPTQTVGIGWILFFSEVKRFCIIHSLRRIMNIQSVSVHLPISNVQTWLSL